MPQAYGGAFFCPELAFFHKDGNKKRILSLSAEKIL